MQTASDQNPSDVPNKSIDQNAQRVSYFSTINWASGNSPQHNQVRSNTKRTEIRREMERIGRTYFTLTALSACFSSTLFILPRFQERRSPINMVFGWLG